MKLPLTSRDADQDLEKVAGVSLVGLAVGIALVAFAAPGSRFTTILLALSFTAVGVFIGFLFGIPRTSQRENGGKNGSEPSADPAGSEGYQIRANTNLEQISDWLTKILVGIGLTQLTGLPEHIGGLAKLLGDKIANTYLSANEAYLIGLSTTLYFVVLGFMGGYLLTRLFLTGAFSRSDRLAQMLAAGNDHLREAEIPANRSEMTLDEQAEEAAKKVRTVSFEQLKTADQFAGWAKAQLAAKKYQDSIRGYERSLALDPRNVRVRHEYAAALWYSDPDDPQTKLKSVAELERAREDLADSTPGWLRRGLYESLTFQYLYLPSPGGFQKAIARGKEYLQSPLSPPSATVWINLAAAHGQEYRDLVERKAGKGELADARTSALDAARAALRVSSGSVDLLKKLLVRDPKKEAGFDDLEVFADDPDFRSALGL